MAYLAGFFNFLSPLFKTIISWLFGIIGNYGWTIILFTVMLKLITLPLDIWQKTAMKKTQVAQIEMAPELAKINLKFKNNKEELNKQTMACYKRHGFSPIGGCLPIIINLLLVMFIYVSMFTGMNVVSAEISKNQFERFDTIYTQTYNAQIEDGKTNEEAILIAQNEVVYQYKTDKSLQNDFLWIESISRKDSKTEVFPSASEYNKLVGEENQVSEERYNIVMGQLNKQITRWNGYYILPILVIGSAFLSTFMMSWQEKRKNGIATTQTSILTKFMMPTILGILCFTTNATFGIYLLANTIVTILANFIIDPIVNKIIAKHLNKKKDEKPKIAYSR